MSSESSEFNTGEFTREFLEATARLSASQLPGARLKSLDELVEDAREVGIEELTLRELVALRKSEAPMTLIDLREPEERTSGNKIRGAISIPRGILESSIRKQVDSPNDLIVLFCSDGNRSILSAESLIRMGYRNVRILSGGFQKVKKSIKKSSPDSSI